MNSPGNSSNFDVIVVGVGAMGSAACDHLARRGKRVLGIERFGIPHDQGSYHGITRIIRLAYYEGPAYVDLLKRAYVLWRELEGRSGSTLLIETGSIDAGPPGSQVIEGSIESCQEHDLEHEILNAEQLNRRFPGYRLPADFRACFQPQGGYLLPEEAVTAAARSAQEHGARIHTNETVLEWQADHHGVTVTTNRASYRAAKLVLSAGAWINDLVPQLRTLAVAERQVLGWFEPHKPELYEPQQFPVFNLEVEEGRFYGFPIYGVPGFKVGRYHHRGERGHPDQLTAEPEPQDEALLRSFVERYFPDGAGPTADLKRCMFTNAPDEHFILDLHPEHEQVVIASPCSGHGFKFAAVVGEILADLVSHGRTQHDISTFRLARF